MASYADKGQNASKTSKKFSSQERKVLNFWDSVQTKSCNKVIQEEKFRKDLQELRAKVGINVVKDYIFGNTNSNIDDFLEKRNEIVEKYEGKTLSSTFNDKGEYVYSTEELEQIDLIKSANY